MFGKKVAVIAAVALFAATPLTLASCKKSALARQYLCMGTAAELCVSGMGEEEFTALSDEVGEFLFAAENSLSATRSFSAVSKFNAAAAGEEVEIDQTSYAVFSLAIEMCELTGGAYNPAVYYSVQAYGFGALSTTRPTTAEELPKKEELDKYVSLSAHFTEIVLSEKDGKYYATKPDFTVTTEEGELPLKVDLGGIGKGWCADRVNEMLEDRGVEYGYFSFGGSTMALKKFAGGDKNYTVGPRDPESLQNSYLTFKCADVRLSTSALYERKYSVEGEEYWHIMNPFTGGPARTGISSVTITGGNAAKCDALTTALFSMGKEGAVQFINDNLGEYFVVILLFEGGQGKIITNRPDDVTVPKGGYTVINTMDGNRIVLD